MLRRFSIDNFKSLVDFSLPAKADDELGHLVCLVGLNGSGKSTVLQALDFLSQLVTGSVEKWLEARGWERNQLVFKGSKKRTINFSMCFDMEGFGRMHWEGAYSVKEDRCTSESLRFIPIENLNPYAKKITPKDEVLLRYDNSVLREGDSIKYELATEFKGSIFGSVRAPILEESGRNAVYLLRFLLSGVKSLELLSPHMMRRTSREAVDVGLGGESLAAFIHGLASSEKTALLSELRKLYPRLQAISTKSVKGWKRLEVTERYDSNFDLDARHINDGLLRVAAIVAQTVAKGGVEKEVLKEFESIDGDLGSLKHRSYQYILFDEIENGINPELISRLISYLLEVRQQVIFTTHSPLILNYLSTEDARRSVHLICRFGDGTTKAVRLFDLPEAKDRLNFMGPGEAYLDLGLEQLTAAVAANEVVS